MKKELDPYTGKIVLAWVSWLEFMQGIPATDYLGRDDDFTPNMNYIKKFAEVLEKKGNIDLITYEDLED